MNADQPARQPAAETGQATVTGLFSSTEQADQAAASLVAAGLPPDEISVAMKHPDPNAALPPQIGAEVRAGSVLLAVKTPAASVAAIRQILSDSGADRVEDYPAGSTEH